MTAHNFPRSPATQPPSGVVGELLERDYDAPVSPDGLSSLRDQAGSRLDHSASIPRGFAAIGLHCPKSKVNVGAAIRAAMCYRASAVVLSGQRVGGNWIKSATNVTKGHRHIPVMRGDLKGLVPFGAVPVAVELADGAESLPDFVHPHSAFYIFGPEDGTLGKAVLDWCPRKVMVPTRHCMNLAATVNVVLYDRLAKQMRRAA